MTTQQLSKYGRWTALISFLIGSFIFIIYFFTSAFELLFIGYGFIAIFGVINLGLLISIFTRSKKDRNIRKQLLTTCGLMLLNIPVMLIYCWFAMVLLNTMRITFVNEMTSKISHVKIYGCESKFIDKLDAGERKTVWVGITGDCAINIEFLYEGEIKTENVLGYVTNSVGKRITHKIGWENSPALR